MFSKAYIKNVSIAEIRKIISKFYIIISEEIENHEQDWKFFKNGNDTMIISNFYNEEWVELILNNQFTLYFHDELLKRISYEFDTIILLGYYQSTDGQGRLAKFENGNLNLSIIQSEVNYRNESILRLMDNWGVSNEIKNELSLPNLKEKFIDIEYDLIYKFYKMNGLEWDKAKDKEEVYIHLEINYDKRPSR